LNRKKKRLEGKLDEEKPIFKMEANIADNFIPKIRQALQIGGERKNFQAK
jgi:hypothetical protein